MKPAIQRWAELNSITAPVNGSWIQAICINQSVTTPVNGSWMQALAIDKGATAPVNGTWIQALCEAMGITSPVNGSWIEALATNGTFLTVSALIQTWYDALAIKPSVGLITDLNTLVDGLNSDGNWSEFDLFHVIGGLETDEQRLKPLKTTGGANFTNVNAATLSTGGVTGNGTTSYLDLNWNPTTHGSKYTQNSASVSVYSRTNSANGLCDAGCYTAAGPYFLQLYFGYTGNTSVYRANSGTLSSFSNSGSLGSYGWRRTASNATQAFKNGVSLGTDAAVSSGVPNHDLYLCAINVDGAAGQWQTRQHSLISAGSGLVDLSETHTRVNTFFTARGINVV